jgi:hypothetical protein
MKSSRNSNTIPFLLIESEEDGAKSYIFLE